MGSKWFDGQYKVVPDADELGNRPFVKTGEIMAHKSGAVILRCPACNALQFARAKILNSEDSPTLDAPIQCGSGHCKKCAIWFIIRNGKAKQVDEPKKDKRELPKRLVDAGIGPATVKSKAPVTPRFRLKDLNRK